MVRSQFQLQILHFTSQLILWSITCGAILAVASPLPIAKPHCQSSCGDIEIPYPFGIRAGCYLTGGPEVPLWVDSFQILCDNSTSLPRPFLSRTGLEVLKISMDGTLQVRSPITFSDCSNKTNNRKTPNLKNYPFWYEEHENRFTSMSCGGIAFMTSESCNLPFLPIGTFGGCYSNCDPSNDIMIRNNSCDGFNCCQTTIPPSLQNFYARFIELDRTNNIQKCKSAFLVHQEWFTSNSTNISTINDMDFVPVVLGWHVGQYSNIDIYGPTNWTDDPNSTYSAAGRRYCSSGFHGNPYLIGGCQDINECEDIPHRCPGGNRCINKLGGFDCQILDPQSKTQLKWVL